MKPSHFECERNFLLVRLFVEIIQNIDQVSGRVYNLGGGRRNVISIWQEFGPKLEKLLGKPIPILQGDWRPGDQKVFVADIRKAENELGWSPKIHVDEGLKRLFDWVIQNQQLFQSTNP